jgi:hypothetical protein
MDTMTTAATVPAVLADLIDAWRDSEPMADIWSRYPFLTDDEDESTDSVACETMSARFADYLAANEVTAHVVYTDGALAPFADYHVWVRVELPERTLDIDWTARQYHNLEVGPDGTDWVLDEPHPLVWEASDTHPVAGDFAEVGTVQAVHFA